MTNGVLSTIDDWTGVRYEGCPWRAFFEPIVRWTMEAYSFFESGQLAFYAPSPSHKQVEALRCFHRSVNAIHSQQRKLDREESERAREASRRG